MKADGEVQVSYQAMPCSSLTRHAQMISAEAPVLFAMAAKALIHELTAQAWKITEENKRRTLQVVYMCVVCVLCVCVVCVCVCVCVARALSESENSSLARTLCSLHFTYTQCRSPTCRSQWASTRPLTFSSISSPIKTSWRAARCARVCVCVCVCVYVCVRVCVGGCVGGYGRGVTGMEVDQVWV
jgi:hypothetical protein